MNGPTSKPFETGDTQAQDPLLGRAKAVLRKLASSHGPRQVDMADMAAIVVELTNRVLVSQQQYAELKEQFESLELKVDSVLKRRGY